MNNVGSIKDLLKPGQKNAVSTKELMKMTGLSDRELRFRIAEEREHGAIILSGSTSGYWLPEDREEIRQFIRTMDSRAKNTLKSAQSAREALKSLPGQMTIFEEGDGASEQT